MTFGQMKTAVYDELNLSVIAAPTIEARIGRWLNEGHRKILRNPSMSGLRQVNGYTFTSEASRGSYGLPMAFERIDAIVQQSNNVRLANRTRDWYRSVDPGDNATGTPYVWIDDGLIPVSRQPATTGVWAVSSSASDATQSVSIVGVTTDGDLNAEASATLTGTSRVAIGALTTYMHIEKLQLSSTAVGTISIYDAASSGNLLARIPIGRTGIQCYGIHLWPTPSAALDYKIDGQLRIYDLVNDTDVPMLPESYHDMLPVYARMKQYGSKDGDAERYLIEKTEWDEWTRKLQSYVEFPSDYHPRASSIQDVIGWSNLPGGFYPADGWGTG